MTRTLKFALTALAVLGIGIPASAPAQGSFTVDANLAARGERVFESPLHGCYMCHSLEGKRLVGPALNNVVMIRGEDWLTRWLTDTGMMLDTDPQAMALLEQWNNVRMPTYRLRPGAIKALIHYLASEG